MLANHEIYVFDKFDEYSWDTYSQPYGLYPSGEPFIKLEEEDRVPDAILLRPKDMTAFMAGLFWVDAMAEREEPIPTLILPFVLGSRQDRLNPTGDYLFTAKSIAKLINDRNFPRVIILDPHSDVIAGMIDRCQVVHTDQIFTPDPRVTYAGVICPDAGAEKRASKIATLLGVPLFHGRKTRDVRTGELTGFSCDGLEYGHNKHFLVVDDICDGGGTFVGLINYIHDFIDVDATFDLFVTHGIFSKGYDVLSNFTRIITTDSVISNPSGRRPSNFRVIPVCETLLENCHA